MVAEPPSTTEPLRGVRACVFDAYGTLFDFASAAARCRDDLGPAGDRLTALWRDKQLQYTWLRAVQGRHADFWQVTGDALDFALETLGIADRPLRERLMSLYLSLDAFPEVPAMLAELKAAGVQTAILSNGSPRMLEALVDHAGIGDRLDHVLSVEEVGVFKPDPRSISWPSSAWGCRRTRSASSPRTPGTPTPHRRSGCRSSGATGTVRDAERLPGAPDREVRSLAELPRLIGVT